MKKLFLLPLLLIISFGCKKVSSEYVNLYNPPRQPVENREHPLSTLNLEGNIDILWVIDNSGSMQNIQNNVIANTKIFMEQFVKQKYINWKMGLISTDKRDNPRLGFDQKFDHTLIDPNDPSTFDAVVNSFQNAVSMLGTNGDAQEYTFYNILRHIQDYNGANSVKVPFLRSDAHLAVIMVTDEPEQSEDFGGQYQTLSFLNSLSAFVSAGKTIRFYGAFDFKDLQDCRSYDSYAGSAFEEAITETNGFHISACVSDFGSKLVEVGKDIASLAGMPSILLKNRPKVDTLKVYYKQLQLMPGKPEEGGYWYYDEYFNKINFYSLEFVDDITTASFRVIYDIKDGVRRPGDPDDI